jgi:predicted short-subunit dehydrogenase-like oxidoreductase (DUF2520 family)
MQRLGIVGAGRLGRSLARYAERAGLDVVLVHRGQRMPVWDPDDAVLLAVPDRALAEVAASIPTGPLVVHLSGASDLAPLGTHARRASLHPLMTFPGPDVALPEPGSVATAVAGADPAARAAAWALADALGLRPFEAPTDRALYHAAAVVAGNHATVLLAEAGRMLAAAGVEPVTARRLLLPLAIASLENAVADPGAALTGPAARGDEATLDLHRDALRRAGLGDGLTAYDALAARARALAARK